MKPSYKSWEVAPLLTDMAETSVSHYTPLSSSFTSMVSYHTGWKILPEVSNNVERALKEGKLLELVLVVKETMATLSQKSVSIAVTGDTGNGMSSFINALRVIGHEEEHSAPTGVVRTTEIPASYSSPCFPNVVLWDLPGTGSTGQSIETYLREMQFSQHDFFIIVASEQFSSNHVKLAKAIRDMGKRFYVVWTKLDRDLSTSVLSEIWILQNIQENIKENLQKEGIQDTPVFSVSNLDPLLHDFPKLRDTLHRDLSNIRCHGPIKALSDICENIINDKVALWKEKIANGHLKNTLDIKNENDLGECLKVFRLLFGVDDESLLQVAQSMGTVVMEYKANMKSQDMHTLRRGDWRLKLMTSSVMNAVLRLLGYFPCICRCVTRPLRHMRLKRMLELVAQDAKTVVRKILKDSSSLPEI